MIKDLSFDTSLLCLEEIDSTSAEARRRIEKDGQIGPMWIIAHEQTSGYGRRGREWQHKRGDFAGSYIFSPAAPIARIGEISFITALAVSDGLQEFLQTPNSPTLLQPHISVKWPNDILLNGKKVSGILLEMYTINGQTVLCIGVGINIVSKAQNTPYPTTCLEEYMIDKEGQVPDINTVTVYLDHHLRKWLSIWQEQGFQEIRRAWCQKAENIGKPISVRLANETLTGIFDEIDENGHLIIDQQGQKRAITAGDVFFRPKIDPS